MKTFIYVISGDHGRQKIGITDDPSARIKSLRTGSPYALKFEFLGETENNTAGPIEVEAHFMLNQHRAEGEWFVVPPDVAVTAVMAAAHRLGYRVKPVDADAVASPNYAIGKPVWHRVTTALIGALVCAVVLAPSLYRFDRGDVGAGYLLIMTAIAIGVILIADRMVPKIVAGWIRIFDTA